MWPLRVLCMCLFALVSVHALEGFQPYWGYNPRIMIRRTEPDLFLDEIAPVWKRQSAEQTKRRDQLSRSRCFFNPITC
ncbi:hypothetical protein Y032_0048g1596 [Ancylostoma ceylanicum]|uniref:Uncharacterized protein n=1 Tax=Ancylostoma ceylanicum TaxID=53326 RepID=A0A016UB83_9BILA|nr:hypothetical protein Y032_0048g1596 [Ancylostoma ceylanicum]